MQEPGDRDRPLSLRPDTSETDSDPISADLRKAVASLVLETTTEGVWLIDAHSRTSFVNRHVANLLGYSVEEMLGEPIFTFMDEESRRISERKIESRRAGLEEQHEFKCRHKDGTPVWLLVTANPVFDRQGKYGGALALVSDIREQKAREARLVARIDELERSLAAQTREATEARSAALGLARLAVTDGLTGLRNRRHFDERLAAELNRCRRHLHPCTLLIAEIDQFGAVDDRFGRARGDDLLRAVAVALQAAPPDASVARSCDLLARFGDDQLAILAVGTDAQGASKLATRSLARVRKIEIPTPQGAAISITASIGVASFPFDARDFDQLLAAAQRALRVARNLGGNRFSLAETYAGSA
jgi:diguanylate cyclase (GGDEF)-like protein/PAS domain S-box-containing protein